MHPASPPYISKSPTCNDVQSLSPLRNDNVESDNPILHSSDIDSSKYPSKLFISPSNTKESTISSPTKLPYIDSSKPTSKRSIDEDTYDSNSTDDESSPNMNSIFWNFQSAIYQDSKWQPKIIMDIQSPLYPTQDKIDLVMMLEQPSFHQCIELETAYNYPKGTSLCFPSIYDGIDKTNHLIKAVKLAALCSGTSLTILKAEPPRPKKYVSIFNFFIN